MFKAFPQTLTNIARDWFSTLEPNSIASFLDLADKFSAFFASNKRIRKTAESLMQMCQGPNKTLRSFMTKFNKEKFQIPDLYITAVVSALTYVIKCEAFKMSLSKTPPKSVTKLLTRTEKYINMEETMAPKREVSSSGKSDQKRSYESSLKQDVPRVKPRQDPSSTSFTNLNTSRSNILMEIKDSKELKWPPRLRSPPNTRDKSKYCNFHRDHGHTTEDCFSLKRDIEAFIKKGFLGSYVSNDQRPRNNPNRDKGPKGRENKQSPAISKSNLGSTEDITFETGDMEGISFPHDDTLVISAIITNFEVKRILVDNESAANVLSHEAFVQMGISSEQFKPVKTPLQGFGSGVITPEGIIGLPLTLGQKCYVTSVRRIKGDVIQVTELEPEHENHERLALVEGLEEVKLEPSKKVTIGRELDTAVMIELLSCLSRNIDIFAWNVEDMPGIDPKVAVCRLNVNPGARLVKQRKRQFAPERR
ncbi:uncharacterized protein LOC111375941 [Olea europaea var. sylvestris]|uniref:uncharacterized protein LOC111375941 n=1 Tax=Olea europaea var. sylvestris TaxID=158386 RepID=UPI000C1D70B9|nr:uncharacterized protein LOC111375941 [Olea europaea var. sylvestris]